MWTAGLAVLATLHALWGGWRFDDHFHRVQLLGLELPGVPSADRNIFGFVSGDAESTRLLIDVGMLPWWTLETLRWSFWRPLASATHALDYALWPDSPMAMHAHSLVWFALLVFVVGGLYRRFLGATWVAGLATVLYALDDARAIPAAWIANRNALIAGVLCVLALWAHDRWRRDGWRPGALLGPLALGLSLLAAEMGVATLAYLGSYALFLERNTWRERATSLLGHAAVAASWLYVYHAGGHGAAGSAVYTNALSEPIAFLDAFATRFPMLLLDQLGPPVSTLYATLSAGARATFAWIGVATCVAVGLALAPLLRRDRTARFWALGCVLSLVPVTSAMPNSRLLLLSGLGAMGLIAQFLGSVSASFARTVPGWRRRLVGSCAAFLVFFHALVGPILLPLVVWGNTLEARASNGLLLNAPLEGPLAQKTVIIVNAPLVPQALTLPLIRLSSGLSTPGRLRVLGPGVEDVHVERLDERTLLVTPSGGYFNGRLRGLFRAPEYPMRPGQSVELTGMRATVVALGEDGSPASARFRFDRTLEDPDLIWLFFAHGRFVPFQLPGVGEEVVVAGSRQAGNATPPGASTDPTPRLSTAGS